MDDRTITMENRTFTYAPTGLGDGDFKKVARTLIRLERVDGENICSNVDGENQDEIFEMLGDCIAGQLYDHPEYRKPMKKMFRQILVNTPRDFEIPANGWLAAAIGAFALIGFIWTFANLFHGLATIFLRFIGVA